MKHDLTLDGVLTSNAGEARSWHVVIWDVVRRHVRRLQMRILTHSFYARLMAVKRVTSNRGRKTPGIDGILGRDNKVRMQAASSLKQHGYNPQPLRRICIPKKNGKRY